MLHFLFGKKKRVFFFLTIMLLFMLISLQLAGKISPASPLSKVLVPLVGPIQSGVMHVSDFWSGMLSRYVFLKEAERENERLREELNQARLALLTFHEVQRELIALREHFQYAETSEFPLRYARVVGRNPSPWFYTLIVNIGSESGIVPGMPVINEHGAVGRVIHTSLGYSQILTIQDPNFAVGAVFAESRDPLIAVGGIDGVLSSKYLRVRHTGQIGEMVHTSGTDTIFPPGIPLGRITALEDGSDLFAHATIAPFVDVRQIESVLIMQYLSPEYTGVER